MKVTLTTVYKSDKDKQGQPLINKNGKPYTKLAIKTKEHDDTWLSGFDGKLTTGWIAGAEVEIEVKKNGNWTNFTPMDPDKVGRAEFDDLVKRVSALEVKPMPHITTTDDANAFSDIPNPDDEIPF